MAAPPGAAVLSACGDPLRGARALEGRACCARMDEQQLGSPEITASEASARDTVTVFVPVNDASVVSSVDGEAHALDDARLEIELARDKGPKRASRLPRRR